MQPETIILIKGITREGCKFRPIDWAERLYYALASDDQNGRSIFNPLVNLKQGDKFKCFVINSRLEEMEPMAFDFLMDFARSNDLEITDQDHNPLEL